MKKFLLAAPLALAVAGLLATPASAARWSTSSQIRAEIAQLDRQVDRARGLSQREEQRLERKVDQLRSLYRGYARNGLNRAEINALSGRIDNLRNDLARQSHDRNGHNGRDWNDHSDRHDDHGGRDHR
jgi:hypothetical protein